MFRIHLDLSIPYWSIAIFVIIASTALLHLFGSFFNEPRNNAGRIFGFIQGLVFVGLGWALVAQSIPLILIAAVATGSWLVFSMICLSHP